MKRSEARAAAPAAGASPPPDPPSHLSSAVSPPAPPSHSSSTILARRRLVAACSAAVFAAAAFSVVVACASAAGWAVGHMVQLGIESTASGDNRDFANAVGEALAQAQTKLARRMQGATDEAYATVVNGALGDIREFFFFFFSFFLAFVLSFRRLVGRLFPSLSFSRRRDDY